MLKQNLSCINLTKIEKNERGHSQVGQKIKEDEEDHLEEGIDDDPEDEAGIEVEEAAEVAKDIRVEVGGDNIG